MSVRRHKEHLGAIAATLPNSCGVYLFFGENPALPLYVGKSVKVRARVRAHIRAAREARLIRQTRQIEFRPTAGEVGALLLEASLIKQLRPLFNKQLRRNWDLCSLQFAGDRLCAVHAREVDFSRTPNLFGLYSSRTAALNALQALADEHHLCLGRLGLEKVTSGRRCFRASLGYCGGVCDGRESLAQHDARLLQALQQIRVACWPYPGAVAILEQAGAVQDWHIVQNWCYLGTVPRIEMASNLARLSPGFDADGYRILSRSILGGTVAVQPLPGSAAPDDTAAPRKSIRPAGRAAPPDPNPTYSSPATPGKSTSV